MGVRKSVSGSASAWADNLPVGPTTRRGNRGFLGPLPLMIMICHCHLHFIFIFNCKFRRSLVLNENIRRRATLFMWGKSRFSQAMALAWGGSQEDFSFLLIFTSRQSPRFRSWLMACSCSSTRACIHVFPVYQLLLILGCDLWLT